MAVGPAWWGEAPKRPICCIGESRCPITDRLATPNNVPSRGYIAHHASDFATMAIANTTYVTLVRAGLGALFVIARFSFADIQQLRETGSSVREPRPTKFVSIRVFKY